MVNHRFSGRYQMSYPRYWAKFPRQSFDYSRPVRGWTTDMAKKARQIEECYQPGYTNEPFVQLIEETADEYRVVAEWMPGKGWTSPLIAAGFLPHPAITLH